MALRTAQIAKNKGNASFKSGNWADAVGHYTAAILADRADPTYPLNRAAAYLKLGKHRDAERDCTTALTLDSKNVKALFRRAQARIALENLVEAEKDLLDGLKIEPANTTIKAELATVKNKQVEVSNKKTGRQEPISIPPPPSVSKSCDTSKLKPGTASHRITRSVPIDIIEPAEPGLTDFLKPVHSRVLSPPPSHNSPTPSSSVPKFQPHVGGGIFRADGKHTILRNPASRIAPSPASAVISPPPGSAQLNDPIAKASTLSNPTIRSNGSAPAAPLTHFAFTRAWNSLSTPQDQYSLLSRISPESLPALFQDSLEPEFLVSLLRTFKAVASPSTKLNLIRLMCALPAIPRFNTVLLFLSQNEKRLVSAVWDAIDDAGNNEGRRAWVL